MKNNILIKAENLRALNYLVKKRFKNKIDLIYIDPPFSTDNIFTFEKGRVSTISRSRTGKVAYKDKLKGNDYLLFLEQRRLLLIELLTDIG